ncbi:uncharacterized protein LOC114530228 [Dendronephthya gigantea]|uniref:uncharacterized protein LOC114530228 n=1 Tax=Dendronephthya gigantea TaxID=151771 RepID=UPI0010695B33|nr:uncharacterized protein LOC114530228 [Dendronephthya gigantea]
MSFDIASGLYENKPRKKKAQRLSIYDRQREEETIRNAANRGYLRRMTVEFLNDTAGLDDRDLPTLGYLNVSSQQLSSLGALEMCISLRICILPGNYITEFDALAGCSNLWALDLHGNQIKRVPGCDFWSALSQLQIVFLHDNGIAKLETIRILSSSSSLLILTLYDTPLSLKKNYRHHVVNGIWSLKALDSHVISDEEIIEDSTMPDKFSALHKNFKVDLTHTLKKESSLQTAVRQMEELRAKVNKIQSKHSPVLLIQKTFRMFAIRKRYKYLMATRVWAATSIQRFYRFHKGIQRTGEDVFPPPTSPFIPPVSDIYADYTNRQSEDGSWGLSQHDSSGSSKKTQRSRMKVENLSVQEGESSSTLRNSKISTESAERSKVSITSYDLSTVNLLEGVNSTPRSSFTREQSYHGSIGQRSSLEAPQKKVTRRMTIDLHKLESSAIGTIESATCELTVDSSLGLGLDKKSKSAKETKSKTTVNVSNDGEIILIEQRQRGEKEESDALHKRRLKPEMVGKYRTVRVFLGDMVESKGKNEVVTEFHEDGTSGFRLQGEVPPKQRNEPVAEMLLSKREMGEDVRRSLRQFRRKPTEKRKKPDESIKLNNDQKLFLRTHGTMGLACLRAVHQAYMDRARAQKLAKLNSRVNEMKERRELGVERLQTLKQEYQETVMRERIRDGVKVADTLRENEARQNEERRKVSEQRQVAMVEDRIRQSHLAFAREFACQQNSVSQALRNHDHAEAKKEQAKKKTDIVRSERQNNSEKRALVKRYMEHRRLMNQVEMEKTKEDINIRLLENAEKHFMEVTANMQQYKAKQSKGNEFYPLPPLNAPNRDTPLAVLTPAMVSQWEECLQRDSNQLDDEFSISNSVNILKCD